MISLLRAVPLLLLAAPLLAQARTVDEGTFVLTRNGVLVGREMFRIVRNPLGAGSTYRATAQLTTGGRRSTPSLTTDSTGLPESYAIAVQDRGTAALLIDARARPGRFSIIEHTPHGESAREYTIPDRAVVLDDEISHQYYFVALARQSGPIMLIVPQNGAHVLATLQRGADESIEVGGRPVAATHYTLIAPGGRREFWVDLLGRVLKVEFPGHGLIAQRDESPR